MLVSPPFRNWHATCPTALSTAELVATATADLVEASPQRVGASGVGRRATSPLNMSVVGLGSSVD